MSISSCPGDDEVEAASPRSRRRPSPKSAPEGMTGRATVRPKPRRPRSPRPARRSRRATCRPRAGDGQEARRPRWTRMSPLEAQDGAGGEAVSAASRARACWSTTRTWARCRGRARWRWSPGDHTLVVRRPGYRRVHPPHHVVEEGKPTEVAVTLEAVAGVVTVTSDVPEPLSPSTARTRARRRSAAWCSSRARYEIVVSKRRATSPTRRTSTCARARTTRWRPTCGPRRRSRWPARMPRSTPSSDAPSAAVARGRRFPSRRSTEVSTAQPWFKRWYVLGRRGRVVAAAAAGTVVATQSGHQAAVRGSGLRGQLRRHHQRLRRALSRS